MDQPLAAILLAAGLGTRMRSAYAKVLHQLAGEPLITRAVEAFASLDPDPLVVVVGHQAEEVAATARRSLPNHQPKFEIKFAMQREQRGTGDAARSGLGAIPASFHGDVL